MKRKIIVFLLLICINSYSMVVKLNNKIMYPNAKIILNEKVFGDYNNKIEIEVNVGESVGRLLVPLKDIYELNLDASILNPSIARRQGKVEIRNFKNNLMYKNNINPLYSFKTANKSYIDINFNEEKTFRIGSNSSGKFKIYKIVPADVTLVKNQVQEEDSTLVEEIEEYYIYLEKGKIYGILNKKLDTEYKIENEDYVFKIRSSKFYIEVKDGKKKDLTVFALDGNIKIELKSKGISFKVPEGKYIKLYNLKELLKPQAYNTNLKINKIKKFLDKF